MHPTQGKSRERKASSPGYGERALAGVVVFRGSYVLEVTGATDGMFRLVFRHRRAWSLEAPPRGTAAPVPTLLEEGEGGLPPSEGESLRLVFRPPSPSLPAATSALTVLGLGRTCPWHEEARRQVPRLGEFPLYLQNGDALLALAVPEGDPDDLAFALFSLASGFPLLAGELAMPPSIRRADVRIAFALDRQERVFGVGELKPEENPTLDLRGRRIPIYHDHLPGPSHLAFPLVYTSRGMGFFADHPARGHLDLGASDPTLLVYEGEGAALPLYLWSGSSLAELVGRVVRFLGPPPLPPLWLFGYLQSKYGYRTRAEVEALVEEFRRRGLGLDAVFLDLYWFRRMGDLSFDEEAFPRPEEFLRTLRDRGTEVVLIEEPYVVEGSRLYEVGLREGVLTRRPDGTPYVFPFWSGRAALWDFTDPRARNLWAEAHEPLLRAGVAGIWTDLNEPEDHPPDAVHREGPASLVHNAFAYRMHEAVFAAFSRALPDARPVVLSRSAWPGSWRFGVGIWSGDTRTTWSDLAAQIPVGISASLTGFFLWNSDVGGFLGDPPSPEMYVRWFQFGTFTPLLRPHGAFQDREPWAFGDEAYRIVRAYLRLRRGLLPYWYALAREASTAGEGVPLLRPAFWESWAFAEDADRSFLVGPAIFVRPVVEPGQEAVDVVLPGESRTAWLDVWTGKVARGGTRVRVSTPLAKIPLWLRVGSIVPVWEGGVRGERVGSPWEEFRLVVVPPGLWLPSSEAVGEPEGSSCARLGFWYEDDFSTTAHRIREAFRETEVFLCAAEPLFLEEDGVRYRRAKLVLRVRHDHPDVLPRRRRLLVEWWGRPAVWAVGPQGRPTLVRSANVDARSAGQALGELLFGDVLPVGRAGAEEEVLRPQVIDFGEIPADEDIALELLFADD
ncbi:glycoside hydrolase family 31 protein [Brockia lithotrophica]|uniref:Alpha-glucosidase (Family GH31 glycosyl hydrolase) n=1 Tax=Brockia lithotrophica TaxID=933949 RepID=A0A660KWQ8_9BACL|nr:glycoside hydrolase family 31 protein [Brockia lithotrophica]RKQ84131.1 alpha-glucosidase (family GH31 glycosyl hydrolase) [Brockia lithotrophica]